MTGRVLPQDGGLEALLGRLGGDAAIGDRSRKQADVEKAEAATKKEVSSLW